MVAAKSRCVGLKGRVIDKIIYFVYNIHIQKNSMTEIPKLPVAEVPTLSNAVTAAPTTAAQVAQTGVNAVKGFVGPLAGPALAAVLAYWGLKTVIGQPPKLIKNIVE